jgi:MFS family permease
LFTGNLAEKFGAKWIFGGPVLVGSILSLLTPLAARVHYKLLIAIRVILGIVSGPAFPAAAVLWGKWVSDETVH